MSPVSELRATAYVDPGVVEGLWPGPDLFMPFYPTPVTVTNAVPCTEARLVMDEGWSPRISAQVVIPWTAERAAALDPRAGSPRITVRIARHWHGSLTLGDLTEAWAGLTLGDLSAEWVGLTLGDLTEAWGTDWGSGWRAPDEVTADLCVRARRVDYAAATITVRAASDELLAQDARAVVSRPEESLPSRVLALLASGSVPVVAHDLSAGEIFTTIPAGDTTWRQSIWDAAAGLCTEQGLRLWCDESRTWRLTVVDAAPATTVDLLRVAACEDDVNRDGDWADVLVWVGTGTNSEGAPLTETRTHPDPVPSGPHRVHVEEVDYGPVGAGLPMPSYEELAARLAVLASRDRVLTITATADPTVRPGLGLTTGAPSLLALGGVVARVEWAVPEDTMTITTRSTTEA